MSCRPRPTVTNTHTHIYECFSFPIFLFVFLVCCFYFYLLPFKLTFLQPHVYTQSFFIDSLLLFWKFDILSWLLVQWIHDAFKARDPGTMEDFNTSNWILKRLLTVTFWAVCFRKGTIGMLVTQHEECTVLYPYDCCRTTAFLHPYDCSRTTAFLHPYDCSKTTQLHQGLFCPGLLLLLSASMIHRSPLIFCGLSTLWST